MSKMAFIFLMALALGSFLGAVLTMQIKYVIPYEQEQLKRKPLKVYGVEDDMEFNRGLIVHHKHGKCPRCNSLVSHKQNYCEICGQALDWRN